MIHWKTFAVCQAVTIMYCTQQVIRGEYFCNRLKNRKKRESFPTQKLIAVYGIIYMNPGMHDYFINYCYSISHAPQTSYTMVLNYTVIACWF